MKKKKNEIKLRVSNADTAHLALEHEPKDIKFYPGNDYEDKNTPILELQEKGNILVKGKKIKKDIQVYHALREFLHIAIPEVPRRYTIQEIIHMHAMWEKEIGWLGWFLGANFKTRLKKEEENGKNN